ELPSQQFEAGGGGRLGAGCGDDVHGRCTGLSVGRVGLGGVWQSSSSSARCSQGRSRRRGSASKPEGSRVVVWNQTTVRRERWRTRSWAGSRAAELKEPTQVTAGRTSTGPKAPAYWSGYSRGGVTRWTGAPGKRAEERRVG